MSGEAEAAGALATAGLVASEIDGKNPGAAGEGACLNCGAQLGGRFCSNCGQVAQPHRSLGGMVNEFVFNLWNFDTKAWRTLPKLLFRPGTLTREYVHGKRARYISPLAAFLLSIFLMFFAFSTIELPANTRDVSSSAADLAEARQELAQAQAELEQARAHPDPDQPAGLEARLAENGVRLAQGQVARIERQIEREQARRAAAQNASSEGAAPAGADGAASQSKTGPTVGVTVAGQPVTGDTTWQEELREAVDRGDVNVNLGHPALNERALQTLRNPDLALYQIKEAASNFSFLLAPLSLPFVALLFLWRRGVTLYDHMSYALYALAFAALLFSTIVLLGDIPFVSWASGWLFLTLPVHMYFHIGGAYALGWFSALWRTIFMMIFAVIVASIFFSIVIILGLVG